MLLTNSNFRRSKIKLLIFCALLFAAGNVGAATRTWDGGGATDNFSDAANWSGDAAPTAADDAVFNHTSTKNANVDAALTINSISINGGYTGTITQTAALTVNNAFAQSAGTFQGAAAALTVNSLTVSGGAFRGGSGLISGSSFGSGINQSGGTFSSGGDVEFTFFTQTGGTFNAPPGVMTIVADWTHTAGGTFNAGTGTVKFTGYNTFNCINTIGINVAAIETFNNLIIANSFCNRRVIDNADTLIVNNDFRIAYGSIGGGRIRPLGTTTIDATNNGYVGSTTVEYTAPNTDFVINNPASVVNMFPVEMNAANSTLTSSGAGRINFVGLTLTDGTVNQGAGVWGITNPGFAQSGGIFNGSAAALFVSNGTGNPLLTNGVFNSGTGKVTSSFRMTGGTMSIAGDMDTSLFTLEGGTFNAPLGTMLFTGGNGNCSFTHTTAAGTFNPRAGTVAIQQGICGFDVNSRENFNNIIFRGTNIIAANDTLVVNGNTVFSGGGANGGSIEANGDVRHINGGTGNTNGNPNVGTTVLKFVDAAARTVNFNTANQTYATLATLVDNPNITINFGATDAADVLIHSLALNRGTINQGAGRASFLNNFAQSGGVYNAGTFAGAFNLPTTGFAGDFALSGGDFNAGAFTQFSGNYAHAAGGNFNAGAGTVAFSAFGGQYNATIDADQTENFNNVVFSVPNGLYARTIAANDTIVANGNLTITGGGYVNGGTLEAKKNFTISGGFLGGNSNVLFSGAGDQTYTNANNGSPTGTWTVNKPATANLATPSALAVGSTLFLSGNIGNPLLGGQPFAPLNIVAGNVRQTASFNHSLGSLTLAANTTLTNLSGGTLTLAGNVTNDGTINFNANGSGCQADAILIRSSQTGTRRNWSGAGIFRMIDVDARDQAAVSPLAITTYSSTDNGNNANWIFDPTCSAPTAAAVGVSGRAIDARNRGIARVRIELVGADGVVRQTQTNAFGFYNFESIAAGGTYVLNARHKTRTFVEPTIILTVKDETGDVNFVAN